MLIDIEKYVRQLLPPNRREPVTIALATMLLWPAILLVNAFNVFRNKCLYDIAQPGQLAVLQFRLRELIDHNIQILDADGFRLDFRVIVPDLTPDKERQVRAIVEMYRLRSKRYEVKEQPDWSTGDGVRWWTHFPAVIADGEDPVVAIALDGLTEEKNYRTRIVSPTGTIVMDAYVLYRQTDPTKFFIIPRIPGSYKVYVGPLSATVLLEIEVSEFDLTWADYHATEPAPSLQSRVQNEVRQLYIMLYSGRANIAPFTTRIFNAASALVHTFTWPNPQGQWHNLPELADGTYSVECIDVQGGVTPRRTIQFVTVASSLSLSDVSSSFVTDRYRISMKINDGAAPYAIQVKNSANAILFTSTANTAGSVQITLPPTVGPQYVKVVVIDSSEPVAQVERTITLATQGGSGGNGNGPQIPLPHGIREMESPSGLYVMRHNTVPRIVWNLKNDGTLSDTYSEDEYSSGGQRRKEHLGAMFNVFYRINGVYLRDGSVDIDYQDIPLRFNAEGKAHLYVQKFYVKASDFSNSQAIEAAPLSIHAQSGKIWHCVISELSVWKKV